VSTSSIAQDSLDFLGIGGEEYKLEDSASVKKRARSYSMRSDKNGDSGSNISPEILDLEKQVVDVLKKYQVGTINLIKMTSSQIPSIANDFPESPLDRSKKLMGTTSSYKMMSSSEPHQTERNILEE
jgi:hypothetical protein